MRKIRLRDRFKVQTDRTEKRWHLEIEGDILGGLMVASVTLFGVSFVFLGTAA